jgi:AraC-like DNA-binding protein
MLSSSQSVYSKHCASAALQLESREFADVGHAHATEEIDSSSRIDRLFCRACSDFCRAPTGRERKVDEDVGYESEAAFNRAFKREFGLPPARYRNERKGVTSVSV